MKNRHILAFLISNIATYSNGMFRVSKNLRAIAKVATRNRITQRSWRNLTGSETEERIKKAEEQLRQKNGTTPEDQLIKQKYIDQIEKLKSGQLQILINKKGDVRFQEPITVQDGTHELATGEKLIFFDCERMIPGGMRGEGFWAPRNDPDYKGCLELPTRHALPWIGKADFLAKLADVEKNGEGIQKWQFKGLSMSRIIREMSVGSTEFHDNVANIKWPGGYGTHYIGMCNCKPSREFYRYIMNFNRFKKKDSA